MSRNHLGETSSPTPTCDALRNSGSWNPNWDAIAGLDAQWMEKFAAMGVHPTRHLDPKTIEFLSIAVDASVTHMYGPGVRRHIRKALQLGATKEEIGAVLQLTSVLGLHTMSLAVPLLLEELQVFGQRGHSPITSNP